MDKIELEINRILSEWNPLCVPDFIKYDEYTDYIVDIKANINNSVNLREFLLKMLDKMKIEHRSETLIRDVNKITKEITNLV